MRTTLFDLIIFCIAILFVLYRLNYENPSFTPAAICGIDQTELTPPLSDSEVTTVTLWATAPFQNCWRAFVPVLAAKLVTEEKLRVEPRVFTSSLGTILQTTDEAARQGSAPDIVQSFDYWFSGWARDGLLIPIDSCMQEHPQFANVDNSLWRYAQWEGKTWVVPIGLNIAAFYYDKTKLRQLHWKEEDINDLSIQIQQGQWTIADMWATIKQARELGVIQKNAGFWGSYGRDQTMLLTYLAYGGRISDDTMKRLTINQQALEASFSFHRMLIDSNVLPPLLTGRGSLAKWPNGLAFRDAVANGRALFWVGTLSHWRQYAEGLKLPQGDDLATKFGVALFPSAQKGKAGVGYVTGVDWYGISSEKASGRQLQNQACEILAQTLTPSIHGLNSNRSVLLSAIPLPSSSPNNNYINSAAEAMRKDTIFLPIDMPGTVDGIAIMQSYLMRVELGELSPKTAAAAAVMQLQREANFFVE